MPADRPSNGYGASGRGRSGRRDRQPLGERLSADERRADPDERARVPGHARDRPERRGARDRERAPPGGLRGRRAAGRDQRALAGRDPACPGDRGPDLCRVPARVERDQALPHRGHDRASGLRRARAGVVADLGCRARHRRPGAPVGRRAVPRVLPFDERRLHRRSALGVRGPKHAGAQAGPRRVLGRGSALLLVPRSQAYRPVQYPAAQRLRRRYGDRDRGHRAHAVAPRGEPGRTRHTRLRSPARQRLSPHGRLRDDQVDALRRRPRRLGRPLLRTRLRSRRRHVPVGAKGMAEQGYTAEKILEYYYPGTTLGWLSGRAG